MDYRIMNPAERKYTFRQSQQISMQTGQYGKRVLFHLERFQKGLKD